ncbi:anti-sigma F factor [Bhargavaea cecembensis]|uniref:anti-sigma F factor n=1 Tax=Bhargavaea cecembensis TaxID=394098 RepID=UPI00058E530C|nr:anti-sigma F factor [Bhargavaea cecembensis]
MENEMTLTFSAISENEALARMTLTFFIAPLDPTLEEISEYKTIISEAATNAIIHGYSEDPAGQVEIRARLDGREVTVSITDRGGGIADVEEAMQPMFTTKPETERSGMGFTIMESFADSLEVKSEPGEGTTVTFRKTFAPVPEACRTTG